MISANVLWFVKVVVVVLVVVVVVLREISLNK